MPNSEADYTTSELRSFITFRFAKLQAAINAQALHILREYSDLGQTEWRVMFMIADSDANTMINIVRESAIDKAQVSRAVKRLIEKSYIKSELDPNDHRQQILSITREGMRVYKEVYPHMRDRQKAIRDSLSTEEFVQLQQIFDKIEGVVGKRDF